MPDTLPPSRSQAVLGGERYLARLAHSTLWRKTLCGPVTQGSIYQIRRKKVFPLLKAPTQKKQHRWIGRSPRSDTLLQGVPQHHVLPDLNVGNGKHLIGNWISSLYPPGLPLIHSTRVASDWNARFRPPMDFRRDHGQGFAFGDFWESFEHC